MKKLYVYPLLGSAVFGGAMLVSSVGAEEPGLLAMKPAGEWSREKSERQGENWETRGEGSPSHRSRHEMASEHEPSTPPRPAPGRSK